MNPNLPALLAAMLLCSACGLAETGSAAATVAAAKKAELERAQAVQAQLHQQLDASAEVQRQRMQAMEEAGR